MAIDNKENPLVGFQITDYDEEKEIVTIQLHMKLLNSPGSISALQEKCKEIIEFGPNVKGLRIEPREE